MGLLISSTIIRQFEDIWDVELNHRQIVRYSSAVFILFHLSFDGGGGWFYPPLLRIIFTAKYRHFQGCLRVWSRGHQVLGHSCKLAIPCHAIFYIVLQVKRGCIILPTPSPIKSKDRRIQNAEYSESWCNVCLGHISVLRIWNISHKDLEPTN